PFRREHQRVARSHPPIRRVARRWDAVVQRTPRAGQPFRRLTLAPSARRFVVPRPPRPLHTRRGPRPHRLDHRDSRPRGPGHPHIEPHNRRDQHGHLVPVRPTRSGLRRDNGVGRTWLLGHAATTGGLISRSAGRRTRTRWLGYLGPTT